MGDKVRVRKETDHPAKVPKYMLSGKGCGVAQNKLGCWLRSSHHLKEVRNSSLVE